MPLDVRRRCAASVRAMLRCVAEGPRSTSLSWPWPAESAGVSVLRSLSLAVDGESAGVGAAELDGNGVVVLERRLASLESI